MEDNKNEKSVNEFVSEGERIIKNTDSLPNRDIIDKSKNADMGFDFLMLGTAKLFSRSLPRILNSLNKMEREIFSEAEIKNLNFPQKISLYKMAREVLKEKMNFIKETQEDTNFSKMLDKFTEMASYEVDEDSGMNNGEKSKKAKEALEQLLDKKGENNEESADLNDVSSGVEEINKANESKDEDNEKGENK